ncbi:MAG: ABC transporter ATP-binding protein [Tissierellia bacterium]|nr:ABC transporter ATP-binding protein [Tissierellia bacterium]
MGRLLEINDLHFSFKTYGGTVKAVRGVTFHVDEGEIVGIVGESGCGKSVTAQCIVRLNPEPPGFFEGGSIIYKGTEMTSLSKKEIKKYQGSEIGFIFQDPMTSLNPTMRIGKQIEESIRNNTDLSKRQAKERAIEMLNLVGIPNPEKRYYQYPHEFSGGMKQRAMIAIALACNPSLLIADEPTTSLDVTIEAQILDLMKELQSKLNTSIIMITHDLGVVASLCHRVIVMYGGMVVEQGKLYDIFYNPRHPYTWGLLKSIPSLTMDKDQELIPIEGTPPDLFSPPVGCPFAARCEYAMEICYEQLPPEYQIDEQHSTVCWLEHPKAPKVEWKR